MRVCVSRALSMMVLLVPGLGAQTAPVASTVVPRNGAIKADAYGKLPLSFEANRGQTEGRVRFLSRGNGYSLFLTDTAAVLSLRKGDPPRPHAGFLKMGLKAQPAPADVPAKTDVVRMELAGANRGLRVEGADKLPGTANYFIGNDPAKWRSAVPTFGKVRYAGVYPGVDLVYYGNQNQLEYDFIVAPRADPKPIRLRFAGARKLKLNPNGDLEVLAANGQIAFHKPVVYQEIAGRRQPVEGKFTLLAKNTVSFTLDGYDHDKAVVIDPVLAYSTYLGGTGNSFETNIAADSMGNLYIVGSSSAAGFPLTSGAFQATSHDGLDMFIAKINPSGNALVYSTFLGGTGHRSRNGGLAGDVGRSIAVDDQGNAYIAGNAFSTDFPTTPGAYQSINKAAALGETTGFVTKLKPDGTGLVYSTYLGGSGSTVPSVFGSVEGDACSSIAVDGSGDAFVAGGTTSMDYPVTPGAYQTVLTVGGGGFVSKLNAGGTSLSYSTFVNYAAVNSIAIDSTGAAYVGGVAVSGFQTTPAAFQTTNPAASMQGFASFVAKVNPSGSALTYATFLGGSGNTDREGNFTGDSIGGLAVDPAGEAYVVGYSSSLDFPITAGAIQTTNKALTALLNPASYPYMTFGYNYFATKLNASASGLIFSTYLGSGSGEQPTARLVLDSSANAFITGSTFGIDFPVTANAFQAANNSAGHPAAGPPSAGSKPLAATTNGILTELSPTGALLYSSYFGGSGYPFTTTTCSFQNVCVTVYGNYGDYGQGLAIDSSGNLYLAGWAESPDFPVTGGAFQTNNPTHSADFIAKFNFAAASSTNTLTALTTDAPTQNAGAKVTFTPHVQSLAGGAIPTGTVAFTVDGAAKPAVALDSTGRAPLAISTLSTGTHTLIATYSGDSTYTGSTSPTLMQTIVLVPSSIAVVSGASQSGAIGTAFAKPILLQVNNVNGVPVPNVAVSLAGTGLKFSSTTTVTNSLGQVSITATPQLRGILPASASVVGTTPLFVLFSEIGVATPTTTSLNLASAAYIATGASAAGASLQAAAADFNNDGFPDLVLTNTLDANASLLLGKGDGTFQASSTFAVGNGPYGVAAGDFNGDGKPDVAVVNGLDNTVSILLNGATGLPAAPTHTYAVGSQPYGVSVADLNRDGKPDLVVTNNGSQTLSVLFGDGDGTFQAAVSYPAGNYPFVTAVADVNNDGYPDVIVENYGDNTVGVYLNTGAGAFLPQATYATGVGPFSVATGDFNGDGYPDLAVANLGANGVSGNTVSVLLNDKTGKFAAAKSYATGSDPTSVLAQDLNGDGVLDLAVTNLSDGTVSVLLGKGDGTFLAQTVYAAGTQPYSLVSADFNGDGKPDLAVTSFFDNTLGVLLQTGSAASVRTKGLPPRSLKPIPPQ